MDLDDQIYFELLATLLGKDKIPFRSTINLAIQCAESCNVQVDPSVKKDRVRYITAKLAGTTRNYLLDVCSNWNCFALLV